MDFSFTDITILLDRSGSMRHVCDDTIGGINAFIEGQQNLPGKSTLSLIQFDDKYEPNFVGHDIKIIKIAPKLTRDTYQPRGWTRLLDAIGRAIDETGERLAAMPEDQRPGKVIFVIQTDGFENDSRVFRGDEGRMKIADKIRHQTEVYNWQFVFLGANQDAIIVAQGIGIAPKAAMTYAAKDDGTSKAFMAASSYVTKMRCAQSFGEMDKVAFTDEQRQEQEELLNS
jgi:hypothetical protein